MKQNGDVGAYIPAKYAEYAYSYNYLIKNIEAKANFAQALNSTNREEKIWVSFPNTSIYSPISYLQYIPIWGVWKKVQFSPPTLLYLLRLCSLGGYILFGNIILRLLPYAKLPVLVLLLLPMSLSLGAAVTSDVMVVGGNFLWCALVLHFFCKKEIKNLDIILLIFVAAVTALCKNYFLNIFIIFLLPRNKFSSVKKYIITLLSVIILGLLPSILWAKYVEKFVIPLNDAANPFVQLEFIKSHFGLYLIILVKSVIYKLPRIIITMIGVLGWQDTRLDFITYAVYPILFYISIKCSEIKKEFLLSVWQKGLLFAIFVFGFFVVSTYMYLSWSPIGSPIILGLNGKYYLPMMIILIFCMLPSKYLSDKIFCEKDVKLWCYLAICFCLFSSVLSILHRFYGLTPNLYYNV